MAPIINEESLLEDTIEGISERLGRSLTAEELVDLEGYMDDLMDDMFNAQSSWILHYVELLEFTRRNKYKNTITKEKP